MIEDPTEPRGVAMAPALVQLEREVSPPDPERHEVAPPVAGSRRPDAGLSTIPEALEAIARGEIVIVVDDHDRENEGDFLMAAQMVTPEAVNFMITHGRGLLCLPLTGERLDALDIGPMVPEEAGHEETAFTVAVDLDVAGSTGISAHDRSRTIRHALNDRAHAEDFRRPGHVFPLRARDGGVLERPGHTEASVDLARLAGLAPAGVICEIMNPDGTMARLPALLEIAERWNLHLITIADLIEHRRRTESLVHRRAEAIVPTAHGRFRAIGFATDLDDEEHVAFVLGDVSDGAPVLARLHSECLTGDVFGSRRCDCGPQLDEAMRRVAAEGRGVVVYLKGHEGRGIGLTEKLRAYALQDGGHDTVTANVELGHPVDGRDYTVGAQILRELGISQVKLLTNNPKKRTALAAFGIEVTERIGLEAGTTADNLAYLTTKRDKLGHELVLDHEDGTFPSGEMSA